VRDNRRTRLILALLLLTAFTLITLDYRASGGGVFGSMRRTAASVFGPVERVAADVVRPVRHAAQAIGSIGSNHKKLQDAQRTIEQLRQQLRDQPFQQQRVDELDKLLQESSRGQYTVVAAQVISVSAADGFEWTATIDVGSIDGVTPEMTVLNGDGLVGRTTTVGTTTSTILLAVDPSFHVGVRLPNGTTGVVTGRQQSDMSLELIDKNARVKPGDGLVTWGSNDQQPFVWGVQVGAVATASSPLAGQAQTATVKPYVDFNALDIVGVVVKPPRTNPRSSLLESPAPTVTATVTVTAQSSAPASGPATYSAQASSSDAAKQSPNRTSTATSTPKKTATATAKATATTPPPPAATTSGATPAGSPGG